MLFLSSDWLLRDRQILKRPLHRLHPIFLNWKIVRIVLSIFVICWLIFWNLFKISGYWRWFYKLSCAIWIIWLSVEAKVELALCQYLLLCIVNWFWSCSTRFEKCWRRSCVLIIVDRISFLSREKIHLLILSWLYFFCFWRHDNFFLKNKISELIKITRRSLLGLTHQPILMKHTFLLILAKSSYLIRTQGLFWIWFFNFIKVLRFRLSYWNFSFGSYLKSNKCVFIYPQVIKNQ